MNYGLCKKLTFLLYEYHYTNGNVKLEKDLCEVIHQLEKRDWHDLKRNYDECINSLQNIPPEYSFEKPYNWVNCVDDLIEYLEYLPISIAEDQAERQIARSEAFGDYIYENGYDEVMRNGFSF